MSASASAILKFGIACVVALQLLQLAWHAWWLPPDARLFWPTLAIAMLPLLPALWVSLRNPRRGVLIGGIVCLFYFCHGVAELCSGERLAASLEIVLSLAVIGASGWDARHYRRPAKR